MDGTVYSFAAGGTAGVGNFFDWFFFSRRDSTPQEGPAQVGTPIFGNTQRISTI
jgi:hypothetical protein